jgi:hypothetical protein
MRSSRIGVFRRVVAVAPSVVLAAAAAAQEPGPAPRPRLVVVLVVDQLATWSLAEARPHLPADGGFAQLARRGVTFSRCAFRHSCTETGPGHATIATGAVAAVHGIVGNEWWDRHSSAARYCAADQNVRPIGGSGPSVGPGGLLVPTVGDLLKAQRGPQCRVVAIGWKDRSAILMAGRRADLAIWMDTAVGGFATSTAYAAELPEWLTRPERRRPLDRWFGAVWQRVGPDSAYAGLVDDRSFEGPDAHGRRVLPQTIDGGVDEPGPAFWSNAFYSPFANDVLLEAARAAIGAYRLGADDHPDVLWLAFGANDAVGHRNGPDSVEVRDMMLRLDAQLEALLRLLDAEVGDDRHALLLTSDHGIGRIPESLPAGGRHGGRAALVERDAMIAAHRALLREFGAPPEGHRSFVAVCRGNDLYLERAALAERGIDPVAAARVAAHAMASVRGVERGYATADLVADGGADIDADGDDPLRAMVRDGVHAERSGDVYLVPKRGWLFSLLPASHGSPWEYDREVPLHACGPGIARGVQSDAPVTPGLVAVLVSRLCGIAVPEAAADELPAGVLAER